MKEKKGSKSERLLWDELIKKPTRESVKKITLANYEIALEFVYQKAKAEGQIVHPDEAITEAERLISRFADKETIEQTHSYVQVKRLVTSDTTLNIRKEAHHFAVDLFYSTYDLSKLGAPRLNNDEILEDRENGMSFSDIARKLELPFNTPDEQRKSKDVVRHRYYTAKKNRDSK